MGGRSGPKTRNVTSKGSSKQINRDITQSSSELTFDIFMQVISATNPAIAALYTAYKVTKFVYPIVTEGVKEYNKTKDGNKTVEKMAVETAKQSVKEIEGKAIDMTVKTAYSAAVKSSNVKTNPVVDTIVTSVMSEIAEQVFEGVTHE